MADRTAHGLMVDGKMGMHEGSHRALARHGYQVTTVEHGAFEPPARRRISPWPGVAVWF